VGTKARRRKSSAAERGAQRRVRVTERGGRSWGKGARGRTGGESAVGRGGGKLKRAGCCSWIATEAPTIVEHLRKACART
jgi:hypothetical protein